MNTRKLFVGIPINDRLTTLLQNEVYNRKESFIHWTKPSNLHVTACFIGYVSQEDCIKIQAAFRTFQGNSFRMKLKHILPVARKGRIDMIWMTFETSEAFNHLYHAFHSLLGREVQRPPLAHATLARVKKHSPELFPLFQQFGSDHFMPVQVLNLYECQKTQNGTDYIPIETICLD